MQFNRLGRGIVDESVLGEEDPGASMDQFAIDSSQRKSVDSKSQLGSLEFSNAESPSVAAAESRSLSVALVSSIEAVVRARLLKVHVNTHLADVAAMLSEAGVSLAAVCGFDGVLVGVITDTLVVKQFGLGRADVFTTPASGVMSTQFTTCYPTDSLPDVLTHMHSWGLIHVTVIDTTNRPVGVVYARDGLRALLAAGNFEDAQLRDYVMGVGYR